MTVVAHGATGLISYGRFGLPTNAAFLASKLMNAGFALQRGEATAHRGLLKPQLRGRGREPPPWTTATNATIPSSIGSRWFDIRNNTSRERAWANPDGRVGSPRCRPALDVPKERTMSSSSASLLMLELQRDWARGKTAGAVADIAIAHAAGRHAIDTRPALTIPVGMHRSARHPPRP